MSNLIRNYPETLTNVQIYKLTMDSKGGKMSDAAGQILDIAAWALYEDADTKTGEMREVLSILTVQGDVVSTISATFKKDFLKMVDVFGEELKKIEVITGVSKNNRTYVTCAYAE